MKKIVKIIDPWLMERFPKAQVYTSLEGENPGGSIKDHMTKSGLEEMIKAGSFEKKREVAEITAGSAGMSLAHYAKELELKCHIFLPSDAPLDLQQSLKSMDANLYLKELSTAYEEYESFIKEEDVVPFNQMFDLDKSKYYSHIGQSFKQNFGSEPCAVLGAIGTGHSLHGVGDGAGGIKVSCEPASGLNVNGVRNIDEQKLGDKDPCILRKFDKRIIVEKENFYPEELIFTDIGQVEVGASFRLVLGACVEYLSNTPNAKIFAIGAKNRRFLL